MTIKYALYTPTLGILPPAQADLSVPWAFVGGLTMSGNPLAQSLQADCVAVAPVTLSGVAQTIDGVAATNNKIVLATAQGDAATNGVYKVQSGAWVFLFNANDVTNLGQIVTVRSGTTYSTSVWAMNAVTSFIRFAFAGGGGGGDALVANPLSQFAATTSLQLKNTISDETGSGALVFANTPTLVTPVLGVATATSINKITVTQPATGGTLTVGEGSTLTLDAGFTLHVTASATVSGTNTGDQTNISGNAGTVTGLSVTAGKTLTVSNTLSIAGTDGEALTLTKGLTITTNAGTIAFTGASKTLTVPLNASVSGTNTGDQTLGSLGAAASGANTDITSVLLSQTGLIVKGSNANGLTIKPNETYTAGRTLNLILTDTDRTLTIGASASISGSNTGDQTLGSLGAAPSDSAYLTNGSVGGLSAEVNIQSLGATLGFVGSALAQTTPAVQTKVVNATTNDFAVAHEFSHTLSAGTAAAGIGVSQAFTMQNAVGDPIKMAYLHAIATNAGAGTEAAVFKFMTMTAGALDYNATIADAGLTLLGAAPSVLTQNGTLVVGSSNGTGDLTFKAGNTNWWTVAHDSGNLTAAGGARIVGNVTGALTGNASTVTTNANLGGDVTSSGNTTTLLVATIITKLASAASDVAFNSHKLTGVTPGTAAGEVTTATQCSPAVFSWGNGAMTTYTTATTYSLDIWNSTLGATSTLGGTAIKKLICTVTGKMQLYWYLGANGITGASQADVTVRINGSTSYTVTWTSASTAGAVTAFAGGVVSVAVGDLIDIQFVATASGGIVSLTGIQCQGAVTIA